jgi:hypothetical protein
LLRIAKEGNFTIVVHEFNWMQVYQKKLENIILSKGLLNILRTDKLTDSILNSERQGDSKVMAWFIK